eukprot:TRINITY_DN27892_c0_g3_i1.p1 TRINITY_DN27892_c0_g3~~TRINITY_DN27892_c0_g3_i1.p1  ORF type:complete len:396 (-),score=68.55 TRINITY_DN27892_c0_g3_i1:212-1399(-)
MEALQCSIRNHMTCYRRFEGVIKNGSIDCHNVRELFFDDAQLDGTQSRGLALGARVSFAVLVDESGKPHAFDLHAASHAPSIPVKKKEGEAPGVAIPMSVSRQSRSAPETAVRVPGITDRRFWGTLVKWNSNGGFGFIECPEVSAALGVGSDVFLHSAQVGNFQVGARISFGVFLNKDGKPQAKDLQPDAAAPMGIKRPLAAPMSNQVPMMPQKPGKRAVGSVQGDAPPSAAEMPGVTDGKVFYGTLTSWNDRGGFGFIDNAELKAMFGKDVFLHTAQRGNFLVGAEISFEVFLNKDGRPQAKHLFSIADAPQSSAEMPGVTDHVYFGKILQFNEDAGFGFIECPDLKNIFPSSDIFLHRAQRGSFATGSVVCFQVFLNKNGKPQAKNLRPGHVA